MGIPRISPKSRITNFQNAAVANELAASEYIARSAGKGCPLKKFLTGACSAEKRLFFPIYAIKNSQIIVI